MTNINKDPGILLNEIYQGECHFSHSPNVLSLPKSTKPEVGPLEFTAEITIRDDKRAGRVKITVASTKQDSVYIFKLSMVGLFSQSDDPNMPMKQFMKGPAITIMFPFLREALANLTSRGRFGPVYLNPINTKLLVKTPKGDSQTK